MTDLNGSMMNAPFLSINPNTEQTVLFVVHFSIMNTLFGSHSIARTADADWIGANYEHESMCEVQILENRDRRMRYKKIIQVLPFSSRHRNAQRKKRR